MFSSTIDIDIESYRRNGYLTAPSALTPDQLALMRTEADRLVALCSADPERYARRIEWEKDHLAVGEQTGMERVIRKLEPVSDLSPIFAAGAFYSGIVEPVSAIFGEPVELFEDKLNLKLPGGSSYPWHQDWVCCWRAHTDELITCFIYLEDADESNGCLQVIPAAISTSQCATLSREVVLRSIRPTSTPLRLCLCHSQQAA